MEHPLRQPTRQCLDQLLVFAREGSLSALDRTLGDLARLSAEWDHQWWVARRQQQPMPDFPLPPSPFRVQRQNGRSRVSWACPQCAWELTWECENAPWETLPWPGPVECPLCP